MVYNLNKYQTELTPELLEALPNDVVNQMVDYIESVQLIKWLIQPESKRGFIADRPLMVDDNGEIDTKGRKEIDITKPHILENMDFFRERAIFFEKHGRYTNIPPNPNPKSEYALFWKEELRRWEEGLVREDGEWIPGYLYFYWNYSPIWLVETEGGKKTKEQWLKEIMTYDPKKGKKKQKGKRKRKFPKPWLGDYLFYHYVEQARSRGKHGKLLKTRGVGFSFKMGAISPCNMYIYPGSGNPNFHLASEKVYIDGDKGIWGKVIDCLDWIAEKTPLPRMRLTNKTVPVPEIQLGYKDEYGTRKGLLSSVFGISLKDNPNKARGIRGPLIHYEEDGIFDDLETAWSVNRKATEDGDVAFGFMLAGGTGGVEGASFEGSEKLFYSPGAYNIYSVPNVYDRNTDGNSECGFFWAAYMNRNGCYDEDTGEPDVIKSLIEILINRKHERENSYDPAAIIQKMAEEPIVPQEAIMRTTGVMFPAYELKEILAELRTNSKLTDASWKGKMIVSGDKIEHRVTDSVNIINKFPHQSQTPGGIEIFAHPVTDKEGKIQQNLYIAGCDPVDDDGSGTSSLLSTFIMNTMTGQIVAEYTGRPQITDDYFEQLRLLLIYYNAKLNYENDKKGLYAYFYNKNSLHLLCETPEILRDNANYTITKIGNKKYGTKASKSVNLYGLKQIKKWLLSESYIQPEAKEGEEVPIRLNMHTLRSPALIEELIKWNPEGNFDRVSALGMLMIYREDIEKLITSQIDDRDIEVSMDPFWFNSFAKKGNNSYNIQKISASKVKQIK